MKFNDLHWLSLDDEGDDNSFFWPIEKGGRPLRIGDSSSYTFTSKSRVVDWEDENELLAPIEDVFWESMRGTRNYVRVEDVWKGRVLEDSHDFFVARLYDEEYHYSDRIVKIWKHKIDQSLWKDIHKGASFRWSFGKRYTEVIEDYQKMSFSPRLNVDSDDLDRMVSDLIKGFEDIFTDPEDDETKF
jgi:hypothetical protein